MHEMLEIYRLPMPQRDQCHSSLLAEIAYLKARLIAVEQSEDSTYKQSLIRSYRELLLLRRQELASARRNKGAAADSDYASHFLAQSAHYFYLSSDAI